MKILIVLDNTTYGDYLSYELNHDGHQVRLVRNGSDALILLKQEPWDCLIIAVVLRDMTGLEVVRQYQDFWSFLSEEDKVAGDYRLVRVIIVTRIRNEKIRKNAYALGVSDYLLFPLKTSLFIDKLNHL